MGQLENVNICPTFSEKADLRFIKCFKSSPIYWLYVTYM